MQVCWPSFYRNFWRNCGAKLMGKGHSKINSGFKEDDKDRIFIIKIYCNKTGFSSVSPVSEWWTIGAGNAAFLSLYWGSLTLIKMVWYQMIFVIIQCSINNFCDIGEILSRIAIYNGSLKGDLDYCCAPLLFPFLLGNCSWRNIKEVLVGGNITVHWW